MSDEINPALNSSKELSNTTSTLMGFSIMREVEVSKKVFHQRSAELECLLRERQRLEDTQPYVLQGMSHSEFVQGIADGVQWEKKLDVVEKTDGSFDLETTDWWLFIDYNTKAYARLNARIAVIVREIADYTSKTQKAVKSEMETLIMVGQMVHMASVHVLLSEYKLLATQYVADNKKVDFSNRFEAIRDRFLQANPQIIGSRV